MNSSTNPQNEVIPENLNDPNIIFVKESGGFYTVQKGTLLYAPINNNGSIDREEDNEINWQYVEEMPEDMFKYVLPVIEHLAGNLTNVQAFYIY